MRNLTIIAAALALSGCGIPKLAPLNVRLGPSTPPPLPSSGPGCPGGLRADLPPAPRVPPSAGFPSAETEEEKGAVADYLTWLNGYGAWARQGWERARSAKEYCDKP